MMDHCVSTRGRGAEGAASEDRGRQYEREEENEGVGGWECTDCRARSHQELVIYCKLRRPGQSKAASSVKTRQGPSLRFL